jgi:predicted dehydrogenase
MAAAGHPPVLRDGLDLRGTAGAILFDGEALRLLGARPEERRFEHAAAYQAAYDGVIAHFAAAMRADTPFETPAPDNLEVLRLVEDAYRAAGARRSG